jgi:hypothetical protein
MLCAMLMVVSYIMCCYRQVTDIAFDDNVFALVNNNNSTNNALKAAMLPNYR